MLAIALRWLVQRNSIHSEDLILANRYLEGLKQAGGILPDNRKYEQAKRKSIS